MSYHGQRSKRVSRTNQIVRKNFLDTNQLSGLFPWRLGASMVQLRLRLSFFNFFFIFWVVFDCERILWRFALVICFTVEDISRVLNATGTISRRLPHFIAAPLHRKPYHPERIFTLTRIYRNIFWETYETARAFNYRKISEIKSHIIYMQLTSHFIVHCIQISMSNFGGLK